MREFVPRWGEGADQSREVGTGQADPSIYTDPQRFELELERLFRRCWLVAERVEKLPNPGDFLVWERLGQSVVVARLPDGSLSAWHNVCRHRGARIAAEGGHCESGRLSCPFHGFAYDLEGRVVGVPERDTFDPAQLEGLRAAPVALETWQGFIWLNFDPQGCEPLAHYLGALKDEFGWYGQQDWKYYGGSSWTVEANWKVVLEGFLEAWHTPTTHKATIRGGYDVPRSSFALLDQHSMMVVPITRNKIDEAPKPLEHRAIANCQYLAFPNAFANMSPELGNVVAMYPVDVNTTEIQGWVTASRTPPRGVPYEKFDASVESSLGLTDRIMGEDLFIANEIAANRHSFGWQGNIFNTLECRITAFHREIEKRL